MTHTEASTPPGERGTCAALSGTPTAAAFTSWVRQLSRSLGREAGGPSPCGAYGHAWRWVGLPGSEPKYRLNWPGSRPGLRGARGSEGGSSEVGDFLAPQSLFPVSEGRGLLSLEVFIHRALQCASFTPYNPQQWYIPYLYLG